MPYRVLVAAVVALSFIACSSAAASAAELGRPRDAIGELMVKRTAFSTTWKSRNGEVITRVSATPIRWKDARGAWRDYRFDLGLSDDGGSYEASAGPAEIEMPQRLVAGRGQPLQVQAGGTTLQMWLEGASGTASARGAIALYADALPGVDVKVRAVPEGLKEDLLLADANATRSFAYRLRVAPGQHVRLNSAGAAVVTDADRRLFELPAPVVTDAGAIPARAPTPRYHLSRIGERDYRLRFAVDSDWLRADDRVFPVTVDPTTQVVSPTTWCLNWSHSEIPWNDRRDPVFDGSTDCNNANIPVATLGSILDEDTGEDHYLLEDTELLLEFPWLRTLMNQSDAVESARLVVHSTSAARLRAFVGGDMGDLRRAALAPAASGPGYSPISFDVTHIVAAWHANWNATSRGYAQDSLRVNGDGGTLGPLDWWFPYAGYDLPDYGASVATPANPDIAKRPYLELVTSSPVSGGRLRAADPQSLSELRILSSTSATVAVKEAMIYLGDLEWASSDDDAWDECSDGTAGPSAACTLRLEGTRGIVRFTFPDDTVQYVAVGAAPLPALPDPAATPTVPDVTPKSASLEVDRLGSTREGRVTIVNRGDEALQVDRAEVVGGDLAWDAKPSPDGCAGKELAAGSGSCALLLTGTRGEVRVWDGARSTDVAVTLADYPPEPAEIPNPATDAFFEADYSQGDPIWISNVGAGTAGIASIEIIYGDLRFFGRDSDLCSGGGESGPQGCPLRLNGTGIIRIHRVDGHMQDVYIGEADPLPVDREPWVQAITPPGFPRDRWPRPALVTGAYDFSVYATDDAEIGSISASVNGNSLGTVRGASQADCVLYGSCRQRCEAILYADPSASCYGFEWRSLAPFVADYTTQQANFRFDSSRYPDGKYQIVVRVTDIRPPGEAGSPQSVEERWDVTIDNHPPYVNVSGGLYEARGRDRLVEAGVLVYSDDAGTGVRSLRLVETTGGTNTTLGEKSQVCGRTCVPRMMTATFSFDPVAVRWADGQHRLRVASTDNLGNTANTDWAVTFYRAAWLYGGLTDQSHFDRLEEDLWTGSNADELWAMLRPADKARVFADNDDELFRERNDNAVYIVYGGVRYLVTSPSVATAFGLDLATVRLVPPGVLSVLPRGVDLTLAGIPGVFEPAPSPDFAPMKAATEMTFAWIENGRKIPFTRADFAWFGMSPPTASARLRLEAPTSRYTYTPQNTFYSSTDPVSGGPFMGIATYRDRRGRTTLYWATQLSQSMMNQAEGPLPLLMEASLWNVATGKQVRNRDGGIAYHAHRGPSPKWYESHSTISVIKPGPAYQVQIERVLQVKAPSGKTRVALIGTNHRFALALV